ncbi:glutathione S-transferase N-terminal domain-containing protein [Labrys wisconsinensis]|uniref:Glutathione S-transferase n=1 Tax=Labrys wisconsinensis TaxID=425677 RepID=A0ABU0J4T2_9HYPH|nr:glutathione S-transferase N-terminal domain-containing protein [Labrys wisconsinensis]MDQ0468463.1 glutathione S-transferase [Labrys wisconsinensis]
MVNYLVLVNFLDHLARPASTEKTMILYYAPGACSLADHIALIEAGLPYKLVSVGRDKRTDDGRDFRTINPKGYTPALELDDGTILTENLAVLTYIAHLAGRLLPEDGIVRWRALEATSFMTTEIHGNFRPFFHGAPQAEKNTARHTLSRRFATIDDQLGEKPFLVSDGMTIADPYLFVMLMWAATFGIDVSERLNAYLARMKTEPSVVRALAEEGLPR